MGAVRVKVYMTHEEYDKLMVAAEHPPTPHDPNAPPPPAPDPAGEIRKKLGLPKWGESTPGPPSAAAPVAAARKP